MASSNGTSSGSGSGCGSGSTGCEDQTSKLHHVMVDERKQKRMLSNRESARRSRMRKQKHLDGLTAQVVELKKENHQILSSLNITTQNYLNVESENSILRAQMSELSHRLDSLNEIIHYLNANNNMNMEISSDYQHQDFVHCENHPWSSSSVYLNQPIMASADVMFDNY
ncbi:hypothetical protein C5167_047971 [Papaver somniferum]|uniref:BZIP domain-containing protein n=1 Tax=Papaver somniferum TaxID=3469 RepID=A0A4Y7KJD2_PAPSO|nr:bZIP transcription factor 11-like [Papaver somniferum]RZC72492.1 hypothetical protein C5167_047971 [Papaver somniferum]